MNFFKKIAFGLLLLLTYKVQSQSKYWLFLKNKNQKDTPAVSAKTLQNRLQQGLLAYDETDLPIDANYYSILHKKYTILHKSKWLNAVSALLTPAEIEEAKQFSFIKEIKPIDGNFYITKTQFEKSATMAPVMSQIQAEVFDKMNLNGKGITIGVIDAGFFEAPLNPELKHLFDREAIKGFRDYVNPSLAATPNKFYSTSESYSDFHGSEVMIAIAGKEPTLQSGLATDAEFYIARTDHGGREWRGEEDNWIAAMEWMDSLGVRLINTSLGYAKGFTDAKENYEPAQMDGKTSVISRAAQMAVDKKGMLIVVSAGNEGDDPHWRLISTPADAEGVLSVGATNQRFWNKIGYSSVGPEFLPYLKPNVSCFSLYGTSLSAPVITGFAACLMQAAPTLTNKQIMSIIEKSAHLYPYGNNFVGYGVPQASRALALLRTTTETDSSYAREIKVDGNSFAYKLPETVDAVAIYHKKDQTHVLVQEAVRVKNGELSIRRKQGAARTTIDLKNEVIELIWKDI